MSHRGGPHPAVQILATPAAVLVIGPFYNASLQSWQKFDILTRRRHLVQQYAYMYARLDFTIHDIDTPLLRYYYGTTNENIKKTSNVLNSMNSSIYGGVCTPIECVLSLDSDATHLRRKPSSFDYAITDRPPPFDRQSAFLDVVI